MLHCYVLRDCSVVGCDASAIFPKTTDTLSTVCMVRLAMDSSNTLSSSPTLPGLSGREGHPNLDGGNWSAVVQAKKGKGKKKLKNARTLSLQTFFSQHGGQENDNFDDCPRDNQDGHATGKRDPLGAGTRCSVVDVFFV